MLLYMIHMMCIRDIWDLHIYMCMSMWLYKLCCHGHERPLVNVNKKRWKITIWIVGKSIINSHVYTMVIYDVCVYGIPSGYLTVCHGKSLINGGFYLGKSSISMGHLYHGYVRRKFRSQTSDNMDRWKAEQGRGREKRKIRREKIRRERVRRKKMQMREKVGKSRNTVFFQWFVAPEGRKVGSLKRRVRSQLARWEMKICTPLWREAHFEVKMCQAHQCRTTFGSWDV